MPLSKSLNQIAMDDLASAICYCQRPKRRRESFCSQCYYALPKEMQRSLYRAMSEDYAGYYDDAKDWLRINTDRIPRD